MTSIERVVVLVCGHIGDIIRCLISVQSPTQLFGIGHTNWIMMGNEFEKPQILRFKEKKDGSN